MLRWYTLIIMGLTILVNLFNAVAQDDQKTRWLSLLAVLMYIPVMWYLA